MKHEDTVVKNPMHDDIYIVEFPKSGVTWLSHILCNIELQLIDRNEIATMYNIHRYIVDVHQTRGVFVNRFLHRTFIKQHVLNIAHFIYLTFKYASLEKMVELE